MTSTILQPFEQLEVEFGRFIGSKNTVACSNGTSALQLAFSTLLARESYVIVPDYTMIACPRAVTMSGLEVLKADCSPTDLLIMPRSVETLIKAFHNPPHTNVGAILAVHIYGRRCNMESLEEISRKYNIPIIEDMAEAPDVPISQESIAACWSFYKNKIIAGEEGGMVYLCDPGQVDRAKSLRCLGFTEDHDFYHNPRGMNARLSNANASPILRSINNYKSNIVRRWNREAKLTELIDPVIHMPKRDSPWVFDMKFPNSCSKVVAKLNEEGIPAREGFKPVSSQLEYFIEQCDNYWKRIFYLPLDSGYEVTKAARIINQCVKETG